MQRTSVASVCLGLLASVGLVAGIDATPAQAQSPFITLDPLKDRFPWESGGCNQGYFCAWEDEGGLIEGVGFYYDKWDWGASDVPTVSFGESINNNSESWWNNGYAGSYEEVQMYDLAGGGGSSYCVPNGIGAIRDGDPAGLKNDVSAHAWRNSC